MSIDLRAQIYNARLVVDQKIKALLKLSEEHRKATETAEREVWQARAQLNKVLGIQAGSEGLELDICPRCDGSKHINNGVVTRPCRTCGATGRVEPTPKVPAGA